MVYYYSYCNTNLVHVFKDYVKKRKCTHKTNDNLYKLHNDYYNNMMDQKSKN